MKPSVIIRLSVKKESSTNNQRMLLITILKTGHDAIITEV